MLPEVAGATTNGRAMVCIIVIGCGRGAVTCSVLLPASVGAASSIGVGRGEGPGVPTVDDDVDVVDVGVELDRLESFLGNFIFGINPVDNLGVGAAS